MLLVIGVGAGWCVVVGVNGSGASTSPANSWGTVRCFGGWLNAGRTKTTPNKHNAKNSAVVR